MIPLLGTHSASPSQPALYMYGQICVETLSLTRLRGEKELSGFHEIPKLKLQIPNKFYLEIQYLVLKMDLFKPVRFP
jgi:hypothetical protein